jgi:DNA-directed RNA polymerase subunit RPC12/RpoP
VTTTPSSPEPADRIASTPPAGSGGATAYRCQSCGATITYAAGTTDLVCPSCGSKVHISAPAGQIHEHSYNSWLATSPRPVAQIEKQHFECQSCGATTESGQIAGACPFCSGALVATGTPDGLIAPEAVVPFRMDKSAATTSFGTWIKSRWFAPNALKKLAVLQGGLQGVYTPHFTYDADTDTAYTGRRGVDRTETYTTTDSQGNSQTQTRTVTDWYPASGNVVRFFNDVLIPATTKVVPRKLAKAGPWALESSVPYQPEYLAGYSALRYDVDPPKALDEAKAGMAKVIEQDCRRDIGGDHQQVTSMDTRYANLMFKLLLLPIWIAAYSYGTQTYQVIVNAQTGEVLGDRPYSKVKIALAIIAGLLLIAAIITLIAVLKHHGQTSPSGLIWPLHMSRLRTGR